MICEAKAPGKLVLSGAYAVLRGAPALVTAVNRSARVSSRQRSTFESAEVQRAIEALRVEFPEQSFEAPFVDASELRTIGPSGGPSQKIGIGSSSAILAASLACLIHQARGASAPPAELFQRALRAHKEAQGGGSGVDVYAAVFGGTSAYRVIEESPIGHGVELPTQTEVEVWSLGQPASTSNMVQRVFAYETQSPRAFDRALGAQKVASEQAVQAVTCGSLPTLVDALNAQGRALRELGTLTAVPIVPPTIQDLGRFAPEAAWLPSGAGGGDILIYVGMGSSPLRFREEARAAGLLPIELRIGAAGTTSWFQEALP